MCSCTLVCECVCACVYVHEVGSRSFAAAGCLCMSQWEGLVQSLCQKAPGSEWWVPLPSLSGNTLARPVHPYKHTHTGAHTHRNILQSPLHSLHSAQQHVSQSDSCNITFTVFFTTSLCICLMRFYQLIIHADTQATQADIKTLSSCCKFYMDPPSQVVCRGQKCLAVYAPKGN